MPGDLHPNQRRVPRGANHQRQIDHEVERLQDTRFQFVGLRRPGITFHINGATVASHAGWPLVSRDRHHRGFEDLAPLACQAEHPVAAPKVAVAWTAALVVDGQETTGLFYNHLPTRMTTGLPVDVHADFHVKADREGMALDPDNAVGAYNLALLERAGEAHVGALREASTGERPRGDFWRLADRPHDAPYAWTKVLRSELFPGDSFDVWVDLAAAFFGGNAKEDSCRDFWNASLCWLETLAGVR